MNVLLDLAKRTLAEPELPPGGDLMAEWGGLGKPEADACDAAWRAAFDDLTLCQGHDEEWRTALRALVELIESPGGGG